mgnify:FL=1
MHVLLYIRLSAVHRDCAESISFFGAIMRDKKLQHKPKITFFAGSCYNVYNLKKKALFLKAYQKNITVKEVGTMRKMLLALLMVAMLCSGMTVMAVEADLSAPIDSSRQEFTSVEDSILIPPSADEVLVTNLAANATVTGDGVRLRSAPSLSAPVLELMYTGERVWYNPDMSQLVYADGHYWYQVTRVETTGRSGYVDWDYIQPDFER